MIFCRTHVLTATEPWKAWHHQGHRGHHVVAIFTSGRLDVMPPCLGPAHVWVRCHLFALGRETDVDSACDPCRGSVFASFRIMALLPQLMRPDHRQKHTGHLLFTCPGTSGSPGHVCGVCIPPGGPVPDVWRMRSGRDGGPR